MADLKLGTTEVEWKSTDDLTTAIKWLNSLPSLAAFDFETASRYSPEEVATFTNQLETASPSEARSLRQKISADGLSNPRLSHITHLSAAGSETEGFVIIAKDEATRQALFDWLVTTTITQIWHNLSFDGLHIFHATKKFPINYEDTQQLAKSLVNHTNPQKALTGLKLLMGHKYGSWAVSSDMFDTKNLYDEALLKYATIDACATFALWNFLQEQIAYRNNPQDVL